MSLIWEIHFSSVQFSSWTSCSKLFRRIVRFWVFCSWSWKIDINLSLECCWDSNGACVYWSSDENVGALFWVLMLLALFPFNLLFLAIFISDFWDKILLCWFIWLVMVLAARVVSDIRLILPCSIHNPKQWTQYI